MSEYLYLPYHHAAFNLLGKIFSDEINFVLIDKFAKFRSELFIKKFTPGKVVESEEAWPIVREILELIDQEMRAIIQRRSVAYWLHLYRRIGVYLSPKHESKTDEITLGLVRQIAELAIQKHGLLSAPREFGRSDELGANLILGGWMKKGLKSLGGDGRSGETIFRRYASLARKNPTWVIRDFSKRDFVDIYAIEGAAYQYWRLTALLRSLGKGARIVVSSEGDWDYTPNRKLSELIESIDRRASKSGSFSSLLGIWIDSETLRPARDSEDPLTDAVFFPIYNIYRAKTPKALEIFGARFAENAVMNFFPLFLSAGAFFRHHHFMRDEFIKKRGYDFELMVSVLAALSSFLFLPSRSLYSDDEKEKERYKLGAFMQTLTRGYHLFLGTIDDLMAMLMDRLSIVFSKEFEPVEVRRVVDSMTLNKGLQGKVSPWSNGPRSVVIPTDGFCVLDLVSVPALLRSIFAFMTDQFGESGTVFERLFREALSRRGFDVSAGVLTANDGSERELDAGVLVGKCLYLFECVSIERPLDYEIGRPRTMKIRRERLAEKLDQARTLGEFVRRNPSGRNFDFSSAEEVVYAVVSPFTEWIWDNGGELWIRPGVPRILDPDEVFSLLGHAPSRSLRRVEI
ncbi:hypothetical protein ABID26_005966 [Mesorhizobium shonense]|uniref:Uncharacterized protein n=1 Tax=Mesorhizobium shonense TaxID=1209948 RepID=A0ABV2I0V7_9HYPH